MAAARPPQSDTKSRFLINAISVTIPLAVAAMLSAPFRFDFGEWTRLLPHVIGAINSLTALALIFGLVFIRQNKINFHRAAMTTAFVLGGLFLICYVAYHISNPANKFAGEGMARPVYFFFLISHVGLSLVVLPLVLRAMFYALTNRFERHKKIVRFAFPIWLYVSASGVVVYLMLYQLFPSK